MKQFHMFFFWEELRTPFGDRHEYVVDPSSAVVDVDNTEKAGIHATHLGMTKFNSESLSGYRTTLEALLRYSQDAPGAVSRRWSQAVPALEKLRTNEEYELGRLAFDVHSEDPSLPNKISTQHGTVSHFYPPEDASPDFVGREDLLRSLHEALFPQQEKTSPALHRKTFIIFGMGGSGKTQFCSKFAEDHRAA